MGLCASCCGRRRKSNRNASERTPLLPKVADPATIHNISRKAVAVVTAFRAGKYPSQDQIDDIIRALLRSNVLKEQRYGKLSQPGRRILQDVREICELVLVFGLEKNHDDRIQELLYHVRQIAPPIEAAVCVATDASEAVQAKLPPAHELERDIYEFTQASKSVLSLFVTSAAFRIFLSTVAKVAQEAVTGLASDISDAAEQVRDVAETVEHIAGDVEATAQEVEAKVAGDIDTSVFNLGNLPSEAQGVVKEIVLDATICPPNTKEHATPPEHVPREDEHELAVLADALQVVLSEARQNPAHIQAINTLLDLLDKYIDSFFAQTTEMVSDEAQRARKRLIHPFQNALGDMRAILERLASGKSLSPFLNATSNFLSNSTSANDWSTEIRGYVTDVRAFLARSLDSSGYIDSPAAKQDTLHLFDRAKAVYGHCRSHNSAFNTLTIELNAFINALQNDSTTKRLLVALSSLVADVEGYVSTIGPNERLRHLSATLWNDATTFVWTALVSFFESVLRMSLTDGRGMIIPIPRVEYTDASVDLALDGRLMRVSLTSEEDAVSDDARATSWSLPSSVHVKQSNEVHLDFASPESTIMRSANKIHIHVEGLLAGEHREVVSLDDIGYYLRYKSLLGYRDEGVVGVDICLGGGSDEGSIDLVVGLAGTIDEGLDAQLSVESVKVTLPPSMGLRVELSDSRHWITNGLLVNPVVLPLVTRFVKKQVEGMLEGVIRAVVEEVGSFAHVVAVETKHNKKSMWDAVMHAVGILLPESNDETRVESTVSMKGVQMDIVAQSESEEPAALAVGVVPQLLPAKGEPAALESTSGVYERAVDEVHEVEERVVGEVREVEVVVREGVGALREEMDDAPQRMGSEEAMDGWRSDVFNIA